jgi:HemY protein
MKTHQQLNEWEALYNLLPAIKSNRKIPQEEWQAIEQKTLINLFERASNSSQHDLIIVWKAFDRKQKIDPNYLAAYASQLINTGKSNIAEDLLIKGLNANPNSVLLALYVQLNTSADKKVQQLEKWLRKLDTSPELLNTLAQLCLQQEQWNRAKAYLENSISLQPTSLAYLLLGQAQEHLNESNDEANASYKAGLELSMNTTGLSSAGS